MRFPCAFRFSVAPAIVFSFVLLLLLHRFFDMVSEIFHVSQTVQPDENKYGLSQITGQSETYTLYNLMEETYGRLWKQIPEEKYLSSFNCTEENANAKKLPQDHPCVIQLIRRKYLQEPASKTFSYALTIPESMNPSDGQSQAVLKILQNKTNGFFIECGAYDGQYLSNTLYMERTLNWKGLLIEADKNIFKKLLSHNRKAYTSPVCLSKEPYPMEVVFNASVGLLGAIINEIDGHQHASFNSTEKENNNEIFATVKTTDNLYKLQCFPLYSMLLAVGRTQADYFSLDVEGSEYKILKTIPWDKLDITTLTVEWNHVPEGEAAITRLMEKNQYIKFGQISMYHSQEVVYVKDFLYDFRQYYD